MSANSEVATSWVEVKLDRLTGIVSWVWFALISTIVLAVVLRYVFGIGLIELGELQWHLHAVGFLMGLVACTTRDRHVRVDVLRDKMSKRTRDWIDLYGILILQLPFLCLVIWSALPFVLDSFEVGERSASAGGLPFRWLLKAVLPLSFSLLCLATVTKLGQVWRRLFASPIPSQHE